MFTRSGAVARGVNYTKALVWGDTLTACSNRVHLPGVTLRSRPNDKLPGAVDDKRRIMAKRSPEHSWGEGRAPSWNKHGLRRPVHELEDEDGAARVVRDELPEFFRAIRAHEVGDLGLRGVCGDNGDAFPTVAEQLK